MFKTKHTKRAHAMCLIAKKKRCLSLSKAPFFLFIPTYEILEEYGFGDIFLRNDGLVHMPVDV